MSIISTTSRIVEEVTASLLEDSGFSTVVARDYGSSDPNSDEAAIL